MLGLGDAQEFSPGTTFRTWRGGRPGRILQHLGAGGQGAVYAVEVEGRRFALKWYHDSYIAIDTTLRARLSRAIERGAPADSFLWPIDLAEMPGSRSFGYVMRLRAPDFHGMRDLIARPPKRVELPLARRAMLCLNIAQAFLELHANGFCYQDINFGNIFFHAETGEILICDNDNVDTDGAEASVYGTRKFMAPEVVRREFLPSTKTDLFSMAVLFFYALHAWHPLEGRREASIPVLDPQAEMALYGTNPVFMYDPADASNGPIPGTHDVITARWNSLSPALRTLFIRSFTIGLRQPQERVLETQWRNAFAAMVPAVFACSGCGYEHAAHLAAGNTIGCAESCLACGARLEPPAMLALGRTVVALQAHGGVPAHLLEPGLPINFRRLGASVETHPTNPSIQGLCNMGDATWRATLPDRSAFAVPPGRTLRILPGAMIEFGKVTGVVLGPQPAMVA